MVDFIMPSLGADMEAGTLVEWKIRPGDVVKRGDIVAVVETQKGAIDIEIFQDGKVQALLVEPGATVPVGTVLAQIDGPASDQLTSPRPAVPSAPIPAPAEDRLPTKDPPAAIETRHRASPAARAAAREFGVELEGVHGTGPGGAITRGDVERVARTHGAATSIPRSGMRQAIAAAMSRSNREIPHYYLSSRIDLTFAFEWLRRHNEGLKPARRLLPVVLLLKAVARASKKFPEMNGFYEDGAFRPAPGVHVGVAVSLREGGLVVPALHDVDMKTVDVVGAELADLIERSRRGQLRSSELADATVTVTSLGERGVETVFGCIFPPQVALIGFGKIVEAPAIVEGRCEPRPQVIATLAADHRVSDGHRGGLFLAHVGALLQEPNTL